MVVDVNGMVYSVPRPNPFFSDFDSAYLQMIYSLLAQHAKDRPQVQLISLEGKKFSEKW